MPKTPREFTDIDVASFWIDRVFADWRDSLTSAETAALASYKTTGYQEINEALRYGEIPERDLIGVFEQDRVADELVEKVAHIDAALSRFRIPETVLAFRGLQHHDPVTLADETSYTDSAFVSTTLIRTITDEFLSAESDEEAVVAAIVIPGGSKVGAHCGAPDLLPAGPREAEILLPRDTVFHVHELTRDNDRCWHLRLEVDTT